jgi:hypothetical protein
VASTKNIGPLQRMQRNFCIFVCKLPYISSNLEELTHKNEVGIHLNSYFTLGRKKGYFILTVDTRNVIIDVSSICNNSQWIKFDHKLPKILSLRFEFTASLITYDSHIYLLRIGVHCAIKHETQIQIRKQGMSCNLYASEFTD